MKNVLFIVYYFPPMGGSGVQRPLKFIKYLREFGWNPIVLCPEPGMYHVFDQSLEDELNIISPEIYKVKGKTPFHIFGGKRRTAKFVPDIISDSVRKMLRLTMFPDNKSGWIQPAIKKGNEIIRNKNIDLIFSTAPPFSNHIIGAQLKKESGLPLILDYRDSWTQNQFFTNLYRWQKTKMKNLEYRCVTEADAIVGLDEVTLNTIKKLHGLSGKHLEIIEHGYDPQDFESETQATIDYKQNKFNLLYSGTFVAQNQPEPFLQAVVMGLKTGMFSRDDIHLHFQGGLNAFTRKLISKLDLKPQVTEYQYLDHKKAVANLKAADALWVLENYDPSHTQIKNGKLFEYFGSGKPILGVLNPGVSADLIRQYGPGYVADVKNISDIALKLQQMVEHWKNHKFSDINKNMVEQFDRKRITGKLAGLFNRISSEG